MPQSTKFSREWLHAGNRSRPRLVRRGPPDDLAEVMTPLRYFRLRFAFTSAALSLAAACGEMEKEDFRKSETRAYAATDSMGATPMNHRAIPVRARATLLENSGATMSVEQPGVLFTINDSGNEAYLFALDTTGIERGAWRVTNATNVDWEAISGGPCTLPAEDADTALRVSRCLYIGDVGDNEARRNAVHIYQVPEPVAQDSGYTGSLRARQLAFTYEDGQHDVEAMFVARDGSINLVTKRAPQNMARESQARPHFQHTANGLVLRRTHRRKAHRQPANRSRLGNPAHDYRRLPLMGRPAPRRAHLSPGLRHGHGQRDTSRRAPRGTRLQRLRSQ